MNNPKHYTSCPACGKRLRYSTALAGKKAICKQCGAKVPLPPIQFVETERLADPASAVHEIQRMPAESQGPHCARCDGPVDQTRDRFEFHAYRRTRSRLELFGAMYLFQQTTTFEGLTNMEGHACPRCIREIQGKYKQVWIVCLLLIGLFDALLFLLLPKNIQPAWDNRGFLVIFGGMMVNVLALGALGIFVPFFRYCVGQRIVIAPQRSLLVGLGLSRIMGGRFGSESEKQYFTRMIFK